MASEAPTNGTGSASSAAIIAAEATQAPVATEAPVEAAPPATPEAPKEDPQERVERQILLLTKKEREVQRQFQTLKQQQQQLADAMKEIEEYRSIKQKAKTDPLAFNKHFGIEYKQLTDQILNDERPTPEMLIGTLKEEIEALKAEKSKEREEQDRQQREQLVNTFKEGIKDYVQSNADKYELIQAFGAHDQIFSMIHNHWKETGGHEGGEYLPVSTVAEYLESQMEQEAKKLLSLKKLSPKMEAKVEAALESKESSGDASKTAPKTLTNTLASQGAQPAPARNYKRDDESLQEAAKLLRWT